MDRLACQPRSATMSPPGKSEFNMAASALFLLQLVRSGAIHAAWRLCTAWVLHRRTLLGTLLACQATTKVSHDPSSRLPAVPAGPRRSARPLCAT
jgi:hypothetical protein